MDSRQTRGGLSIWPDLIRGFIASCIGMWTFLFMDSAFHNHASYFLEYTRELAHYDDLNIFFITLCHWSGDSRTFCRGWSYDKETLPTDTFDHRLRGVLPVEPCIYRYLSPINADEKSIIVIFRAAVIYCQPAC